MNADEIRMNEKQAIDRLTEQLGFDPKAIDNLVANLRPVDEENNKYMKPKVQGSMKQAAVTGEKLKQNIYISEGCPKIQTGEQMLKKVGLDPAKYGLYLRRGRDLILQDDYEQHTYKVGDLLVAIHNQVIY